MDDLADGLKAIAQARVGRVLRHKWRLDQLLGVGGMAAVYAATHRNGKRGAVKMLHLEIGANQALRRRFLREGYVANRVDHPGAVSVIDDDIAEDGAVFLVMELLEGETVEARAAARPGRQLPLEEVLAIADGVLDTLAAAHDKGIVHRDLKPENLFLTSRGEVKVLDFGIARIQEPSASATRTGEAMGTPAFMPPEQALGNWAEVDGRTDLWAVGATMFTLLTGRYVHQAPTVQKLMLAAMTQPAPPIGRFLPQLPAPVGAIIDGALAFDRNGRWQNARAMRDMVRAARRAPATPMDWSVGSARAAGPVSLQSPTSATTAVAPTASPVTRNVAATRARAGAAAAVAGLTVAGAVAWYGWRHATAPPEIEPTASLSAEPPPVEAAAAEAVPAASIPPAPTQSAAPPSAQSAEGPPPASASAQASRRKSPRAAPPARAPSATADPKGAVFDGRF